MAASTSGLLHVGPGVDHTTAGLGFPISEGSPQCYKELRDGKARWPLIEQVLCAGAALLLPTVSHLTFTNP